MAYTGQGALGVVGDFSNPSASQMTAYSDLSARFGKIAAISNALGMLHWDTATMMPTGRERPPGPKAWRCSSVLRHDMITDAALGDLLARRTAATRPRRLGTRQPARDQADLDRRDRAAGRSRRGLQQGGVGLRDGLAQARADSDFAGLLPCSPRC